MYNIVHDRTEWIYVEWKEFDFAIFILCNLAEKWEKNPSAVYNILNTTGILDDYIIPGYDILHTQRKEYLVEDITDFLKEKGVDLLSNWYLTWLDSIDISQKNIFALSKDVSTEWKEVMILLYEYLKNNYTLGEPIFQNVIKINGMTDANLRCHFKKLTDDGVICRFDDGIYYFPKTNILGEKQELSVETVAIHKYIMRKGKRIGYYSGYTLANRMGLSHQVPFTEEITSNLALAPVQEITIKNRKYIVRRPVVDITDENVKVLQFLDCLKDIEKCADEDLEICGQILTKYAMEHVITKQDVDRFISKYPMEIYNAICETGVQLFDLELES